MQTNSELQTLTITHSINGIQLKQPVTIQVPTETTKAQETIIKYTIESLKWKHPTLIPQTLSSPALMNMMRYLYADCSASHKTPAKYIYLINRFCNRIKKTAEEMIAECRNKQNIPLTEKLFEYSNLLRNYAIELKAEKLTPSTVASYIHPVKTLFRVNGLQLEIPLRFSTKVTYPDRAPTAEELQRLINIADLREKVIVSCLALGGFRIGTFSKLRYRHVKEDLEQNTIPVHVHVEAEITKGKYHDYDTFLGQEAVDNLKAYFQIRKQGTYRGYFKSETITDETPLIRNEHCSRQFKPLSTQQLFTIVHSLYYKAGLLKQKRGRLYKLRVHSIRKFFRTQLAALGVDRDYIEYMMGHTVSTYHDIQMKGTEFLRNVYTASGLSIRPKTKTSKIEALKQICLAWGLNPEQVLTKKALSQPHRTIVSSYETENENIKTLSDALKEMMRKELLGTRNNE